MTVALIDATEFHTLADEVFARGVGLVVFGDEQDMATINADKSLVTLGITAPTTPTI